VQAAELSVHTTGIQQKICKQDTKRLLIAIDRRPILIVTALPVKDFNCNLVLYFQQLLLNAVAAAEAGSGGKFCEWTH
jgi:hypothetical protein